MKKEWSVEIRKKLFSKNLNSQVNFLFSVILIIYTIFLAVFFTVSGKRNVKEYAVNASEELLTSVGGSLNNNFETISTMSKMLMFSDEIKNYLTDQGESEYQKVSQAVKKMYSVTNDFSCGVSVFVFKNNGSYINISSNKIRVHTEKLKEEKWRRELEEKAGANIIQINGNGLFDALTGEALVSFVRIINDPETQKEIGIIAVNYTMKDLESVLEDFLFDENLAAAFSEEGEYLCGSRELAGMEEIREVLLGNKKGFVFSEKESLISGYHVPGAPIELIKCTPLSGNVYFQGISGIFIIAVVLLTILCIFSIRMFIIFRLTRPIKKLEESMKQVESGWLHRVSVDVSITEIKNLKDSYNEMLVQLNRLIEELVEKEKIAQQAKLEVMLEQINPHFLYNTLETIGYMALESPREKTYEAVACLGEFYRFFLVQGEDKVALGTELLIVKDYLKIQKFRYGEIFQEQYAVDEECLRCLVPKLILQPLVENSLYHGIRPKGEPGNIKISAHIKEQKLVLSVYDDGIGMSHENLNKVLRQEKKGFGLKKTLERVKCIYDQEGLYTIDSEEGVFFRITFRIPAEEEVRHV